MAAMFGDHGSYCHDTHDQEDSEEDYSNDEYGHGAPLQALCAVLEHTSVMAITGPREVRCLEASHGAAAGPDWRGRLVEVREFGVETRQAVPQQFRITVVRTSLQLLQNTFSGEHQIFLFPGYLSLLRRDFLPGIKEICRVGVFNLRFDGLTFPTTSHIFIIRREAGLSRQTTAATRGRFQSETCFRANFVPSCKSIVR
jgi:hypothetical protein